MLKILVSLFFILSGSLSFAAGTDSGSSNSNSSNSNDKTTNSVDVNIEFHKAKKLIYKKKYKKGLDILKSIEEESPFGYTSADLYNYMGFASRKQKIPNYKEAENYYLKALSFDKDHIGALEYLGELYVETDRRDEALVLLDRIKTVSGDSSSEYKDLNKLLN
ncbi:tetratricopeptide repeat protein [Alphaproteobacteria bacterium]|nr:tetratricopeptide repeat protein [Alphaproteobacteria bacterium]